MEEVDVLVIVGRERLYKGAVLATALAPAGRQESSLRQDPVCG